MELHVDGFLASSAGRPLLVQVQKHRQPTAVSTSAPITEEPGVVFKQNVAVTRDTLREDVAPPSLDMAPRVEPLSALHKVDLPCMEVLFSLYVVQRLAELSTDLQGEVDGHDAGLSGDQGLQKGKLLPKPKARVDAYWVSKSVFSFAAASIDRAQAQGARLTLIASVDSTET